MAVTPQYQALQVKPTYSSGYGTPTVRTVSNVAVAATAKPAANYGYVTNAAQQPAYSTPQPTPSYSANTVAVAAAAAAASTPNNNGSSK